MTTDDTATKASHAPGPSFYQRDKEGCDDLWVMISQADEAYIASISFWDGDDDPADIARKEANARLLAAAPHMFDALKEIVAAIDRLDVTVTDGPIFHASAMPATQSPSPTGRSRTGLADTELTARACIAPGGCILSTARFSPFRSHLSPKRSDE